MGNHLKIIKLIEKQIRNFTIPYVTEISKENVPYKILISCILSLRTKDKITNEVSRKLFKLADTPGKMLTFPTHLLEEIIYPAGFYRNKAKIILEVSKKIINEFSGNVPDNLDELLSFKGVGRKTANLVLGLGYGVPAICVDTHVHRISNRLSWVKTKNPYQTEEELKKIIPGNYWIKLNTIFVAFGQNICLPISPYCSKCGVNKYCPKIGVKKHR